MTSGAPMVGPRVGSEESAGGRNEPRVAAILTAYNRKHLTLSCLRSLAAQRGHGAVVDMYVVDDGSTDGTSAAVAEEFPEAVLLRGDGSLFWGGGMRLAFGTALARDYDHYLWLNDDTSLQDTTLAVMLRTERELRERGEPAAIVAGTTRDPATGVLTYGGRRRPDRLRPLRFDLIPPGTVPRQCETMNGNCVLIPRAVARTVGNIDPAYVQQMGDYDYGLRARVAGFGVWIVPGTVGTCAPQPPRRTDEQSLTNEIRRLWSIKQLAPKSWRTFARRWAGPAWPLYWASPYLRRGWRLVRDRLAMGRASGGAL